MKQFEIRKRISGNCNCTNCDKEQPGRKPQPYTVWWKEETEKRGHQEPMCSEECCREWIEKQRA